MSDAPAPTTQPLGSLVEFPSKDNVRVTRPGGQEITVLSDGKVAGYVLDVEGEHIAHVGGKTITVKAG